MGSVSADIAIRSVIGVKISFKAYSRHIRTLVSICEHGRVLITANPMNLLAKHINGMMISLKNCKFYTHIITIFRVATL